MSSISSEIKAVIGRRLEQAGPAEVLAIASALCGEDEDYAAAAAVAAAARFPCGRFVVMGDDDLVRDRETGLIWTRGNVGDGRMNWSTAQQACEDLKHDDYGGWRLPTIRELLTLVDYERHSPAIDPVFNCESAWYWTSTPAASSPGDCAWGVYFHYGYANCGGHGYDGFVRAVRSGQ